MKITGQCVDGNYDKGCGNILAFWHEIQHQENINQSFNHFFYELTKNTVAMGYKFWDQAINNNNTFYLLALF